ncbi:hypothetical protein FJR37_12020 [Aphanizomenon sp. UHCC 0183]|nr:hypothetical protein [Aphanizomenon sp. UHCC 0183]
MLTVDCGVSRLALKIVVMARQEARGKSEEGLGDFTFLYTVWFYCVHLLISNLMMEKKVLLMLVN